MSGQRPRMCRFLDLQYNYWNFKISSPAFQSPTASHFMEALRIQADAILVSPNQILRPGQLLVRHGKIVACSADCTEQPDLQFPDSLLSAGLVNAHTHLEFSDLTEPFPAGANFPQWIGSVIRHRRKIAEANTPGACPLAQAIASSLQTVYIESHRAGVALIGDIVTRPWSPSDVNAADLSAPPFVTAAPKPSAGRSPALVVRGACQQRTACHT